MHLIRVIKNFNMYRLTIDNEKKLLQIIPQIRVALFGENPNRKFFD